MSIKSHAFGRVTLTGQDAKKFKAQSRPMGDRKPLPLRAPSAASRCRARSRQTAARSKLTLKRG